MTKPPVIQVTKKTKERLKERGVMGESYDALINRLLDWIETHETQEVDE